MHASPSGGGALQQASPCSCHAPHIAVPGAEHACSTAACHDRAARLCMCLHVCTLGGCVA